MGKQFSELSDQHIAFIEQQKLYFVGTAANSGSVNLSPKGGDSLRVISPTQIAWLNLTGSGNESAAHVLNNPRMTLMFCAFEGAPLILRAYGQASVLHNKDAEWKKYVSLFPESVAARQIFILDINMVQSSCGMSVPYFTYEGDREDLAKWSEKQGTEGIEKYWLKKNQKSIDGFESEIASRSGLSEVSDDSF
ncbi:pyridoxamine 5'-phosphate oxidase family protein [Vibrio coralliilyticus]|uniref:pyridoxamine 5'-phosphate oxidase family protein n=1 Tax=Vibrio coralliilyticus TaxID=190893 RepID=UPI0015614FD0|nr:pyridoxamine 5'-phosphate oxidase family protein [Vibrio coralliilyticus]NRF28328.1 pyridoxamine 5'-phosphate oxidase family protein [Vibrio coralliilyticus]NRF51861.1 pyridoxamine 5'-phosphate oxidase family protein [Vibrio coralliilyticus]NRG04740.1 pyridoxamine 5'-phosphate oxidase family protein [Vibrio coralliilyticus]